MADVDIDPFGEHESRTDVHTETGENIPFTPVEDQLGNQTEESKKLHSEENLKEPN